MDVEPENNRIKTAAVELLSSLTPEWVAVRPIASDELRLTAMALLSRAGMVEIDGLLTITQAGLPTRLHLSATWIGSCDPQTVMIFTHCVEEWRDGGKLKAELGLLRTMRQSRLTDTGVESRHDLHLPARRRFVIDQICAGSPNKKRLSVSSQRVERPI